MEVIGLCFVGTTLLLLLLQAAEAFGASQAAQSVATGFRTDTSSDVRAGDDFAGYAVRMAIAASRSALAS